MIFYSRTHKGLIRKDNEDSCYAPEKSDGFFAVVADGMGGHNAGEVASRIVIDLVRQELEGKSPEDVKEDDIKRVLIDANRNVWDQANADDALKGMGSTATVVVFYADTAMIGHVGDSRAYLLRDGLLSQITKDHSYVQILIDSGYMSKETAKYHPHRNVITRAIGTEQEVEVDLITVGFYKNDWMLICSDGLNTTVCDEDIEKIMNADIFCAADKLIEAALSAGGNDNISVIIAGMGGGIA